MTRIIFRAIKFIFHSFGSLVDSSAWVIILWQENVRGTRNASLVVDVVFKCLRQRSNGLKICLPAVFYIFMCFLGFIRYNKTFIACGFRKYENVFPHEYHIPLGRCPQNIWYSWENTFSYFPLQHAIHVYCTICQLQCNLYMYNKWIEM